MLQKTHKRLIQPPKVRAIRIRCETISSPNLYRDKVSQSLCFDQQHLFHVIGVAPQYVYVIFNQNMIVAFSARFGKSSRLLISGQSFLKNLFLL